MATLGLTWDRVRFDRTEIVVIRTMHRKGRDQPLVPEAVAKPRRLQPQTLKDGGPFCGICESNMPHALNVIVAKAGIESCTILDRRRAICMHLARLGVIHVLVKGLAGHASATTRAYFHRVNGDMRRDAVAKLAKRIG